MTSENIEKFVKEEFIFLKDLKHIKSEFNQINKYKEDDLSLYQIKKGKAVLTIVPHLQAQKFLIRVKGGEVFDLVPNFEEDSYIISPRNIAIYDKQDDSFDMHEVASYILDSLVMYKDMFIEGIKYSTQTIHNVKTKNLTIFDFYNYKVYLNI